MSQAQVIDWPHPDADAKCRIRTTETFVRDSQLDSISRAKDFVVQEAKPNKEVLVAIIQGFSESASLALSQFQQVQNLFISSQYVEGDSSSETDGGLLFSRTEDVSPQDVMHFGVEEEPLDFLCFERDMANQED